MLRKYQKAEGYTPLSKEEHEVVGEELQKTGKNSMADLNVEERTQVTDALDERKLP
jgi:hypothetical protein